MKGLPIGYSNWWERLRYEKRNGFSKKPGESSGLLIGPARSGKGTDLIVPMLLDYEGSIICLDTKGQNAAITAAHRQKRLKQNVIALNPFNEWRPDYLRDLPHAGCNPLSSLDPESEGYGVDCDLLAEGIVVGKPGDSDSHWIESARQTVSGVIMTVAREAPPERRNLASVYEIISGPRFFDFARDAVQAGDELIAGRLGRFAVAGAFENRELVSILSTAITNCKFIGNRAIMRSLTGTANGQPQINWNELRTRPTTVYVILPQRYLQPLARWLRLCITAALNLLLVEETRGLPVLLLMDEFPALNHMSVIENCMSLSAGMGLTMLPVVQDAGQLKDIYGERMQSFLSMAGYQLFLPPRDPFTAKLISDLAGQGEVIAHSRSVSIDHATGEPHVTDSVSQQPRQVLLPDEVMALGRHEMLIRMENVPDIIRAKRRPYYEDPHYRHLASPDPYHTVRKKSGTVMKSVG